MMELLARNQFHSIVDEVKNLGASLTDPSQLLSRMFDSCCQPSAVLSAGLWVRLPGDAWDFIESYDACIESSLRQHEQELKSSLDETALTEQINCFSIDFDSSVADIIMLPVMANGAVKGVFAFWITSDSELLNSDSGFDWLEIGRQASLSLEQVIARARIDRQKKNKDWSKYLVRSFENVESNLQELGAATNCAPTQRLNSIPNYGPNQVPNDGPKKESARDFVQHTASPSTPNQPSFVVLSSEATQFQLDQTVASSTARIAAAQSAIDHCSRLIQLAKIVGRRLDEKSVAYDIVNELHAYFGIGRISLAYVRGGKCRLAAISGIESFDVRSSLAIDLKSLCQQIAKSKCPVWHPEQAEQIPPHFAKLLTQYYEHTDAKSIALLPVFEGATISRDPENLAAVLQSPDETQGRLIAILCIEGTRNSIQKKDAFDLWQAAEPIVANAASNAIRHSGIFLYPVWKAIGELRRLYCEHHRTKAILVTAAVVIAGLLLCLWPSQLKLKAEGLLQPKHRSRIYAEVSGTVDQILVGNGIRVATGDPLVKLLSQELEIEYERVRGEWSESKQALISIRDSLNALQAPDENTSRQLRKERSSLEEKTRSLEKQKVLLEQKKNKLNIVSPRDGQVITWDVPQRLSGRPVEPGQHLMTVADETGPWELELRLPDSLSGYLRKAASQSATNEPLFVEFVLASAPSEVHRGRLRTIADTNTFDEKEGSVLRVHVDMDEETKQSLISLKPGSEVIAHIHAGNHSLGYSLFFGFFDWVNRQRFKYLW